MMTEWDEKNAKAAAECAKRLMSDYEFSTNPCLAVLASRPDVGADVNDVLDI